MADFERHRLFAGVWSRYLLIASTASWGRYGLRALKD